MEEVIAVFTQQQQPYAQQEFINLLQACDFHVATQFFQQVKTVALRTYIGSGKCQEIHMYLQAHPAAYVIFDQDISPLQLRCLEECLQTPVMDRSDLILMIFSRHASSASARLQIEAAQLKRLLPRLIGGYQALSRQGGSAWNKGSGETQLELDRRHIRIRIREIERKLKKLEAQRATQRRKRLRSSLPQVSLVGYTNAGKSTIMNALLSYTDQVETKKVMVKDQVFATLDTSLRCIHLPNGHSFLLSDTVGFVSRLPHELIKAFHSTLEEVCHADLLLHVVDAAQEEVQQHLQITEETLQTIHAGHLPTLTIFNKCDKSTYQHPMAHEKHIYISAKEEADIVFLLRQIEKMLFPDEQIVELLLPYDKGSLYSRIRQEATVLNEKQTAEGFRLQVRLPKRLLQECHAHLVKR